MIAIEEVADPVRRRARKSMPDLDGAPRPPDQRDGPANPTAARPAGRGISSMHFVAGALGGAAGSVVTCPFDLVKTRLQSDSFRTPARLAHDGARGPMRALWHFVETGQILRCGEIA
jgi:solute carrier family 25 protein 33/36